MTQLKWTLTGYNNAFNPTQTELLGDRVIVPQSILQKINDKGLEPSTFNICINGNLSTTICATIIEFNPAEENNIYMPDWIFENLYLNIGDPVNIELLMKPLQKATKIKVQPHDSMFLTLNDHKMLLEQALTSFNTLTQNSIITLSILTQQYSITILEIFPNDKFVSVIDTDLEVEFLPPIDYVETKPDDWPHDEEWPLPPNVYISEEKQTNPKHYILSNGKIIKIRPPSPPKINKIIQQPQNVSENARQNTPPNDKTQNPSTFVPFSGKGYRLGN